MTELQGLISFWETILKTTGVLFDPSTLFSIQSTIKHLKQLQSQQGETK